MQRYGQNFFKILGTIAKPFEKSDISKEPPYIIDKTKGGSDE